MSPEFSRALFPVLFGGSLLPLSGSGHHMPGLGIHHFVGANNMRELSEIHGDAKPTAVYYVTTIIVLYFVGKRIF